MFVNKVKPLVKLIKSRAFLFKLVLSILALVFIPLLAMQIFLISQSTKEFQKSNEKYYFSVLQESARSFGLRQKTLSETAIRMSMNEDIQKPLRSSVMEYYWYQAALALKGYGAEIMHVEKAGMYYVSNQRLLVNGFKYTLQDYCEMIEPDDPAQAKKMEMFFLECQSIGYFATSDGSMLYVARPVENDEGIAFFVMNAKSLEENFRASVALHSSFAILNDQGDFLIKGEDFVENIDADTLQNFLSSDSTICTGGINGELLVYKYEEPQTGYTFLLSVNKDESQEQLLAFAKMVRISMCVMVVLMVIVIVVTIYINYRPIYQLSKKYVGVSNNDQLYSEIEQLDSAFFRLDKESSTQREMLADFILSDLLCGNVTKPELVQKYFPAERYSSFMVLTSPCPAISANQCHILADMITESTGDNIYVTSVLSQPHIVIVCLSETSIDTDYLYKCVSDALAEIYGKGNLLYAGEIVTEIQDLRISYRSAIAAYLETAQPAPDTNAEEFSKKLHVLSQCIYDSNEEEVRQQLEDIRTFLYTRVIGEGYQRYYCFELLHTYLAAANSGKVQLSKQEVELLLSFNGMEHLFTLLGESVQQICSRAADTEQSMNMQLQQRLLQYVEDHYTCSELSLHTAAKHIGTSIYVVSRLFKEATGKGFKDYVVEKRLEHGYALLVATQKSIVEIAAESGFDSSSYFALVFKQKYGVPPTKYRSIRKENKPCDDQ